jgi:hypothetical protein
VNVAVPNGFAVTAAAILARHPVWDYHAVTSGSVHADDANRLAVEECLDVPDYLVPPALIRPGGDVPDVRCEDCSRRRAQRVIGRERLLVVDV